MLGHIPAPVRDLDSRLVGLDLDERVVLGDLRPSETSQREISPSVSPSPSREAGTRRPRLRHSYRVVAQDRVHTSHAVDELSHAQIDDDARERERVDAVDLSSAESTRASHR